MKSSVEKTEYFEGKDGQWYFHAVGANNEILDRSEGYTLEKDAIKAATELFGVEPVKVDER